MIDAASTTQIGQQNTVPEYFDSAMQIDEEGHPKFPPAKIEKSLKVEGRKVLIPIHRINALKSNWPRIYPPLVEHLKLQVRMNIPSRAVELRTSPKYTVDPGALQKGEDFVRAFCLGFDLEDAIAMLRLDDLYIETYNHFEPSDQMGN